MARLNYLLNMRVLTNNILLIKSSATVNNSLLAALTDDIFLKNVLFSGSSKGLETLFECPPCGNGG